MPDPRIDAYIAAAAPFARPILTALRAAVHRACPEAEETIRWSMPSFSYRGKGLANMAAFKAHASFALWDAAAAAATEAAGAPARGGMGQLGKLRSVDELPPAAALDALIAAGAARIDAAAAGPRPPRTARPARPEPPVPDDLAAALAAAPAAARAFAAFSPGKRRDYVAWLAAAKRPETRARRLAQAVAQIAEGKALHWKYERC